MSDAQVGQVELEGIIKKLKRDLKLEIKQELKKELSQDQSLEDDGVPLEDKLKSWLYKQGFPLEMEVASAAKAVGFDVVQSECYIDPELMKSREIDLVLSRIIFTESGPISYKLFVECKSSNKGKPWLLFGSPCLGGDADQTTLEYRRQKYEVYEACILNERAKYLTVEGDSTPDSSRADISLTFPKADSEGWIAYGLTQAFAEAGDAVHAAMQSSTKAALVSTDESDVRNGDYLSLIAAPVIVIDVPLYQVSYSPDDGSLCLESVTYGNLLWRHSIGSRTRICVSIVTKQGLSEFLSKCYRSAEAWFEAGNKREIPIRPRNPAERLYPRNPT